MKNLSNKIDDLIKELPGLMRQAEEAAIRQVLAAFTRRIFNDGKAADGSMIGKYDDKKKQTFLTKKTKFTKKHQKKLSLDEEGEIEEMTYKELRVAKGLQVDYVDLQFEGDLFFSVTVGEFNNRFVLGFNSELQAQIAEYNEKHFKKVIFKISEEEKQFAIQAYNDYLREHFIKIFGTW